MRLDQDTRESIAREEYRQATMHGDTCAEAETFLSKWRRARYLMYREELVPQPADVQLALMIQQGCPDVIAYASLAAQRKADRAEVREFIKERLGPSLRGEMIRLEFAGEFASIDQCLGYIDQWIKAKQIQEGKSSTLPRVAALHEDIPWDPASCAGDSVRGSGPDDSMAGGDSTSAGGINAFASSPNAGRLAANVPPMRFSCKLHK